MFKTSYSWENSPSLISFEARVLTVLCVENMKLMMYDIFIMYVTFLHLRKGRLVVFVAFLGP